MIQDMLRRMSYRKQQHNRQCMVNKLETSVVQSRGEGGRN